VTIRAHAPGPGRLARDLALSPQRQITIRSACAAPTRFPRVLVAAAGPVNAATVRQGGAVTCIGLVFDGRRVGLPEGLASGGVVPRGC
jgi:hypothetical protein